MQYSTLQNGFVLYFALHSFMFPTSPKVPTSLKQVEPFDQLASRPVDQLAGWSVGQSTWLASWPVSQLTDYPVGLVGLVGLVGRLASYPVGQFAR